VSRTEEAHSRREEGEITLGASLKRKKKWKEEEL